jgi:hypothetical protein
MIANTSDELLSMADLIGVDRKWIQKKGTYQEHFDICLTKKAEAIQHGARAITKRELTQMLINRKNHFTSSISV